MSSELVRRGKHGVYYANVSYMGVRLRDCLKTSNRDEAQRRLIELKLMVERGDYQRLTQKFEVLVERYKPDSSQKESIVRTNLLPVFAGKRVGEIDVEAWAHEQAATRPQSTVTKRFQVMRELGFTIPKVKFANRGKRFDHSQILTEEQVLEVVNRHVKEKYRAICLISAYSSLRLKNVVQLRRRDVDRLKYLENFPKLRDAIAIKRVVAGDPNPKKQEEGLKGCKWCDGGRIFYHKVDDDGAIASQGFVGRCSLCALPQLSRYRDVHPEMLYNAAGWGFDMSHKERWAMINAGKDPDEPMGVGSAQLAAVAPFGKADPVAEKVRSRELWKEQQREEEG